MQELVFPIRRVLLVDGLWLVSRFDWEPRGSELAEPGKQLDVDEVLVRSFLQ